MIEELKFLKKYLLALCDDLSKKQSLNNNHYLFFVIKSRREIENMKRMLNDLGFTSNIRKTSPNL